MAHQGMDVHRNVAVTGDLPGGSQPETGPSPITSTLDNLFPGNIAEGGEDVGLEWLSIFVEDCLSSTTSYTSQHFPISTTTTTTTAAKTSQPPPSQNMTPSSQDLESPSKPKGKRRRSNPHCQTLHVTPSDPPPLLHQTHWLADSELIFPKKEQEADTKSPELGSAGREREAEEEKVEEKEGEMVQPRRCTHCMSQRTPQWRAGPSGPKTLCNACGVRFKSGRLLPEYRPAKSPTFVSYKHSNSHKKVMEMRMTVLSSNTN
ncbi:GATA transcription factor 7-like [Typha latifolia]|uniref:GATA transcription factor 7-like n=1 Tax=Typha latifolia TaxID=4733 RepID=UPI003C2DB578